MSATEGPLRRRLPSGLCTAIAYAAAAGLQVCTAAPGVDVIHAPAGQPLRGQQMPARPSPTPQAVPVDGGVRVDALPVPRTGALPDLESIAGGFTRDIAPLIGGPAPAPELLVFISLSMPDATLQRLVAQASRAGATLMIRGLVEGSLPKTVARTQALIGKSQVSMQVDPLAFDRYTIDRVPTFVLTRRRSNIDTCSARECAAGEQFAKVAGDVSLDHALRHMAGWRDAGYPLLSRDASDRLQALSARKR